MQVGTIQKNDSLSTRALLVSVNISQWTGRKIDKRATETANVAHKADASAGKYNKKLLPAARELEEVATLASQARKYYYEQTLPWFADGTRIISSKNYLNFQTEFRKLRASFESAVNALQAVYPKLQSDAAARLGDLYDPSEYPENIAEKFSLSVDFMPLPDSNDFRVAVSDAEKRAFEAKIKKVEADAMRDACNRLYSVVKAATEKLADPKSIFRDSLIENIGEIAGLIPVLNISNDAKLDQLTLDAKSLIDSIDAKTIRNDSKARDGARKALTDIENRMGAFMGALK